MQMFDLLVPRTRASSGKLPRGSQTVPGGNKAGKWGDDKREMDGAKSTQSAATGGQRHRARRGNACRQCRRLKGACYR